MQIRSLTAGGAYGTAVLRRFPGYRCKQSSTAARNTTVVCIIQ